MVNRLCNHRIVYWFMSFFAIFPPPLWDSRGRIWKIADNALNLLDVGCGYAHITRSSKASNVFGIDLDRNALVEANRYGKNTFYPVLCAATNLPFTDNIFDTIVATEVLEHIQNDEMCIKSLHRVITSNGILLITTPNGDYLTQVSSQHVRHYRQQHLISLLCPFFQMTKTEKRFDISFNMVCKINSLRTWKRENAPLCAHDKERLNVKVFALAAFMYVALSPVINMLQSIEEKMKKGKYNLVIECTKL